MVLQILTITSVTVQYVFKITTLRIILSASYTPKWFNFNGDIITNFYFLGKQKSSQILGLEEKENEELYIIRNRPPDVKQKRIWN